MAHGARPEANSESAKHESDLLKRMSHIFVFVTHFFPLFFGVMLIQVTYVNTTVKCFP